MFSKKPLGSLNVFSLSSFLQTVISHSEINMKANPLTLSMHEKNDPSTSLDAANQQEVAPKKTPYQTFLKFSGFTLIFIGVAIILMIAGIIVFYRTGAIVKENAGFWLALIGVVMFLFTVIFGFERPSDYA